MRRNTAATGLMLATLLTGSADAGSNERAPEVEADDCIEMLLGQSIQDFRQRQARLRVEITILDGVCEQTVQLLALQTPDEEVAAEALVADHNAVLEQIYRLRLQSPDESLNALCGSVELPRVKPQDPQVSSLAELLSDLRDLQITAVPEPILVIHGVSYRIRIESGISETTVYFQSPQHPRPTEQIQHPLGRWAERLRGLLRVACRQDEIEPAPDDDVRDE